MCIRDRMQGERAILFATDPPYLVGYDGTNHPSGSSNAASGAKWDDADATQNSELYDRFIKAAIAHALEPNAAWYCWHASRRQMMLEKAWEQNGAFVHQEMTEQFSVNQ